MEMRKRWVLGGVWGKGGGRPRGLWWGFWEWLVRRVGGGEREGKKGEVVVGLGTVGTMIGRSLLAPPE